MIVRISTENQYELPDEAAERLNDLDNAPSRGGGRRRGALPRALRPDARSRAHRGPRSRTSLHGSDVILPPPDPTFEEARNEFSGEGLIPD